MSFALFFYHRRPTRSFLFRRRAHGRRRAARKICEWLSGDDEWRMTELRYPVHRCAAAHLWPGRHDLARAHRCQPFKRAGHGSIITFARQLRFQRFLPRAPTTQGSRIFKSRGSASHSVHIRILRWLHPRTKEFDARASVHRGVIVESSIKRTLRNCLGCWCGAGLGDEA